MKTVFIADDGMKFNTSEECEKHEEEVAKKEAEKKRLSEKRAERMKEVQDAYKHYEDLLEAYEKDYGRDTWSDFIIDHLFG